MTTNVEVLSPSDGDVLIAHPRSAHDFEWRSANSRFNQYIWDGCNLFLKRTKSESVRVVVLNHGPKNINIACGALKEALSGDMYNTYELGQGMFKCLLIDPIFHGTDLDTVWKIEEIQ